MGELGEQTPLRAIKKVDPGMEISPVGNVRLAELSGLNVSGSFLQEVVDGKAQLPTGVMGILKENGKTPSDLVYEMRVLEAHVHPDARKAYFAEQSGSIGSEGAEGQVQERKYEELSFDGDHLIAEPLHRTQAPGPSVIRIAPIERFAYKTNINPATGREDRRNPITSIPLPEGEAPWTFIVQQGQISENQAEYLASVVALYGRLDAQGQKDLRRVR